MKATRTYTDAMLGRRQAYRLDKLNLSRVILTYLREQLVNAHSYGATTFGITSCAFRKKPYVLSYHNGQGFDSSLAVMESLYPSTSWGNKGFQGNGGKFSGTILVHRLPDYEHIVVSRCSNGDICAYAVTIDDRTAVVKDVTAEVLPLLEKFLNHKDVSWNVCYLTRYQRIGTKIALQDIFALNQLSLFAPSVFDGQMKVVFGDGIFLDPDAKKEEESQGIYKSLSHSMAYKDNKGGVYANSTVTTFESFVNKFSTKEYEFNIPFSNCEVNFRNEGKIKLSGVFKTIIFPGICRQRGKYNGTSYGLFELHDKKNSASHLHQPMEYNTTLVLNCFKDGASRRLYVDPVVLGKYNNKIAMNMNLGINDAPRTYHDVQDFAMFDCVSGNLKNSDAETTPVRKPFVINQIEITRAELDDDTQINIMSESDIRMMLGGLDEFFITCNRDRTDKILTAITKHIGEDNPCQLKSLREVLKKVFPTSNAELGSLKMNRMDKLQKVLFVRENGSKKNFQPGEKSEGVYQYKDGTPVPLDAKINSLTEGFYTAQMGEMWFVKVEPLKIKNGDKFEAVSEDEWLKHGERLPRNRNKVSIDGLEFEVIPRVSIPKTHIVKNPGNPDYVSNAKERDGRSDIMFKPLGANLELFVQHTPRNTFLNSENEIIRTHFKNVPEKQAYRDRFWEEIQEECVKIQRVIDNINPKLSDDGENALANTWGNHSEVAREYLFNQMIKPLFANKGAVGKAAEIKALVATGEPLPVPMALVDDLEE